MDLRTFVKYPFLPGAIDLVKNIKLDELLSSPIYEDAREFGISRVRSCFTGERVPFTGDENRITGFYVSKLFLMALNDPIITRRFANMVRDEIERYLLGDTDENVYAVASALKVSHRDVGESARELYEKYPKPGTAGVKFKVFTQIHFLDFIRYASKLSGEAFKLVYQPLKDGWIPVTREEFVKIIREAFVEEFVGEIEAQAEQAKTLRKYFEGEIIRMRNLKDEYIARYTSKEFGDVSEDAFPPCLKSIIVKLKNGINLPHQARFFLVTFLHKIGMKNDEIMKIFATAPDFNESMTRYQVEHITGGISKKEYEVPKCSTLQAYGLCIKDVANDNLCNKEWMTHPLLYYKIKKEWLSKREKRAESQ